MQAGISVTVARSSAQLAPLVPQWDALAARALEPNPFYESWSLLPALEAHGRADDLRCLLVWKDTGADAPALAGLFPFKAIPRFRGLPLTALSSWQHNSWPLCTPLVREDAAADCVVALLDWLRRGEAGICAAQLRYLPSDGPFVGHLADALAGRSEALFATETFTRALLRRRADAERYLEAALSARSRKDLRRKQRRLGERGALVPVALRAEDDVERWIADFLALEAGGWKGKAGGALAASEGNRRLASALLREAHRRARLQIVGFDLDGRPVARCCNFLAGDGAYAWRTAYDETFAGYSPGILAEIQSIRAFHDQPGGAWMDSLTQPDNATLNRLWMERRTMQSLVLGAGHWGELWVSMLPLLRWTNRRVAAVAQKLRRPARAHALG